MIGSFEFPPPVRVVYGENTLLRLGELAAGLGIRKALVVSDRPIAEIGITPRAVANLRAAGIESVVFSDLSPNPDSAMVEAGRLVAAEHAIDGIIGLGGGSSMDCAKGINFVLTNGGTMRDYWGQGKATKPMLPSIGIPTTAGTGSEAQINALISDAQTHAKMACGDAKAAFRVAILDPVLTLTQPRPVTATAGFDAISHAVEAFVSAPRTPVSDLFARDAWRLLEAHFQRVLERPDDLEARGAMLLGAHEAGVAIAQAMLGATHACANPLTATYGTTHAVAIGVMLPHVVRWNAEVVGDRYADLLGTAGIDPGHNPGERLADRLAELARLGGLPSTLDAIGVDPGDFDALAGNAATEWTGTFNPRPFGKNEARHLYQRAFS
jgi:alcohol dehydrogenase